MTIYDRICLENKKVEGDVEMKLMLIEDEKKEQDKFKN